MKFAVTPRFCRERNKMGKVVDRSNLKVDTVGKEKYWHHDTFGTFRPNIPNCAKRGCTRKAWLGKYCPDHKEKGK